MSVKIVGYKKKSFTTPDNTQISGYDLHVIGTEKGVTGNYVERIFASDNKLAGYVPALDDEVEIRYNRYGKIDTLEVL